MYARAIEPTGSTDGAFGSDPRERDGETTIDVDVF